MSEEDSPGGSGGEKLQDDNYESGDGDVGAGGNENRNKKRKERLEQNRVSARESRKRKKTMIEELQRTVIALSRENKDLNDRNESLRCQLMEIGSKYPNLVPRQAVMGNTSGKVVGAGGMDAAGSAAESAAAAAENAAAAVVVQAAAAQGVANESVAASTSLAAFPQLSFLAVQQQQLQQQQQKAAAEAAHQPAQQLQPSAASATS